MKNNQTVVYLFRGLAGVGKTFISDIFSKKYNIPLIHKDDINDVLLINNINELSNKISHDILFKILESNKDNNSKIVLDFTFRKWEWILDFISWCDERSIKVISVLVVCSDKELWSSRLNERSKNPKPNQKLHSLQEFENYYGDLNIQPLENEIVLDSKIPVEENIKYLEEKLINI